MNSISTPLYRKATSVVRILAIMVLAFSTQMALAGKKIKTIAVSGNLSFGNVIVGSSAQLSITISNAGNTTLNVSSITLPAGFSTTLAALNIAVGKTATAVIKDFHRLPRNSIAARQRSFQAPPVARKLFRSPAPESDGPLPWQAT